MVKLISVAVLRELLNQDRQVILPHASVLSPSAKDMVKEMGINITYADTQELPVSRTSAPGNLTNSTGQCSAMPVVNQEPPADLRTAVLKIITDMLTPSQENARPVHIPGSEVVHQPFNQAPSGQKVTMTDVIGCRESSMTAGFMTFDNSYSALCLKYDEIDYVIEGNFLVEYERQTFTCKAGDIVCLPAGSEVIFSSPNTCKVFYVMNPVTGCLDGVR